ncbi:MAG: Holliday junction branch migration protein RuvA [Acholeplasmataceae bacterium]
MYAYIKGIIKEVEPTYVTLENGGIGYLIITPNSYRYHLEDEVIIYIHHYLREDMDNLYGFKSKKERNLFIDLISVSGIGPKSALAILSTGETNKITYAIDIGDVKYLTQFPGIGPKSAQQIILDLKGKIKPIDFESSDEVREALRSLGYNNTEINRALKKVDNDQPIEEIIKQALGVLIK